MLFNKRKKHYNFCGQSLDFFLSEENILVKDLSTEILVSDSLEIRRNVFLLSMYHFYKPLYVYGTERMSGYEKKKRKHPINCKQINKN